MKKRRACLSLLCGVCLLPLVLATLGFLLPAQYGQTYLGEMPAKQHRLETAEGKRIIIIGGSSVPFSLDSALLEQLLPGWTVVDYGLYAQLGTVTMLDWARDGIRAGDLVILAPEQDSLALSCQADGECILQACDGSWGLLAKLNPKRLEKTAAAFPAFAGKKLRYALLGQPIPTDIYARSSFNSYGDIGCEGREQNILPGLFQENQPISFDPAMLSPDFVEEVKDFAAAVEEKGASLVYHFSPMNAAALAAGTERADIDGYYDALSSALGLPILGNPHRCILESGWFFDSNFHLNEAGSVLFTGMLAEDIKLYLQDTSPTVYTVPAMPAPLQGAVAGDDSDERFFTYQKSGDGWIIDGVTPDGQQQEALILPTTHGGQPVTGMTAAALHGCTRLNTLTVQPNISTLWDGFADGCVSLQRVILTGERPSDYSVGGGLMGSTQFLIQVPAAALDNYRRSYSWQKYEAWIVGGS